MHQWLRASITHFPLLLALVPVGAQTNTWVQTDSALEPVNFTGVYDPWQEDVLGVNGFSNNFGVPMLSWNAVSWSDRPELTWPTSYQLRNAAFDPERGVIVAYAVAQNPYQTQTWELNGCTWTLKNVSTPVGKYPGFDSVGFSYAGDGKVMLFGGIGLGFGSTAWAADTWLWDGTTWEQQHLHPLPRGGRHPTLTYDPLRNRVVMLEGIDTIDPTTWEWRATGGWSQISAGPSTIHAGAQRRMVWDAPRDRALLLASNQSSSTFQQWEFAFDATAGTHVWQQLQPLTQPSHLGTGFRHDWVHHEQLDVFVTRRDLSGARETWYYVPDPPPASGPAAFDVSATSGTSPLTVTFSDQSTGGSNSWSWDFGDGTSSSAQSPSHTYTAPGTYAVTLTVTGPGGSDTRTVHDLVRVVDSEPPSNRWVRVNNFVNQPLIEQSHWHTGRQELIGLTNDKIRRWDGNQWVDLASGPPGGFHEGSAYDEQRDVLVWQGIVSGSGDETWEWDGTTWTQKSVGGPRPAGNSYVLGFTMTYAGNGNVMLKGGREWANGAWNDKTYLWDGSTWTEHTVGGAGPSALLDHISCYDPMRNRVLLTGGRTGGAGIHVGTWEWRAATGWTELVAADPALIPVGNALEVLDASSAAMVWDVYRDRAMLTGEIYAQSAMEHWEFYLDSVSGQFQWREIHPNAEPQGEDGGLRTGVLHNWGHDRVRDEFVRQYGFYPPAERTVWVYRATASPLPQASFAAAPTAGPSPLAVTFTDQSSGAVGSWLWDFGDGNTSTAQSPSHTYTTDGQYTVTLTVAGSYGPDSITAMNLVSVGELPPDAAFGAAPASGAAPLDVAFNDQSTGAITSWAWEFGDGGTSSAQNPLHTYATPGTYKVSLLVVGPGGCDRTTAIVTVTEPAPVAGFAGAPTTGTAPLDVVFADQSTGAITTWAWDFGDGATSAAQNPTHTYTTAGTYTVSLTVTGPGGSDTATTAGLVTVTEPAPVAAFASNPTSGTAPLNVTFTDQSTGAITTWAWDFGDGATSAAQSPTHTYTTAGTYTVSLTVTGPGGSDTATTAGLVTVTEPAPVAAFASNPTSGTAPLNVTFTDQSTGAITTWAWDFGDGATSAAQSPTHTYTTAGTYTVSLTVTGPGGSDTATTAGLVTVTEPAPVAAFASNPTSGTAPLNVTFTDQSTGAITTWTWDFGDGATSAAQSPTHTYTTAGTYTVSLTVTGPGGSDTATTAGLVTVTEPAPVAAFASNPTSGTAPLNVTFTDQSTGAITTWTWDFGDGATSAAQSPTHTYTTAGTYTVSLTVTGPGGSDTATTAGLVTVTEPAPVAAFASNPTSGTAPLNVTFTDQSTGAITTWAWDFGDGATSAAQSPTHTYTTAGTYTVSLTVTGPGGSDTATTAGLVTVTEPAPVAAFASNPTSGTAPLNVTFTDQSTGAITTWAWDFGDGATSAAQSPTHTYTTAGTYTVSLTVTGPGGSDTATTAGLVTVTEPAPVAAFASNPTSGTAPLNVTFTDQSTGAITTWAWDFGDGATSAAQSPTHTYTTAGTYTVSLTVTGPGGSDTATTAGMITVAAAPAITNFAISRTVISDGDSATLTHSFTGGNGDIDQGVGPVGQGQTVVSPPPNTATTYTLTVTNAFGDNVSADVTVTSYPLPQIQSFVASAPLVTNGGVVDLLFAFTGGNGQVTDGVSSFSVASGTPLTVTPPDDVVTTYTLTVTNPAGDSVQATAIVQAVPPPSIESFVASPTIVVNGQTSQLTARFSGGTGLINPGAIAVTSEVPVTVTPPPDASTLYVLTVTSPTGESVMAPAVVTAVPALPVITNHPQSQTVSAGTAVSFSVTATGVGLSYQWCKDGAVIAGETQSVLALASASPADAGRYNVKVSNAAGSVTSDDAVLTVLNACPDCDGDVVRIDTDVSADFNTAPPTWQGDPALAPYVSFDTSGPTPDTWRLIIDTGRKRLEIVDGATVTTGTVPNKGKNRPAPGIELRSACTVFVDESAAVDVYSHNAQAGALSIIADGDIAIDGVILNRAQASSGVSGRIVIASRCGDLALSASALVRSNSGGDIHLLTGGDASAGFGGDIDIGGLVEAVYRAAPAPTIRLVAFDGAITVFGTALRRVAVQGRRISTTGVVVRTGRDNITDPGHIEMQALGDITVVGNSIQHFAFPNPGTVAVKMLGNHGGAVIDVRSLGGRIIAIDRAFDNVNHDNQDAINRLWAAGDVHLFASGAMNSTPVPGPLAFRMPVVDVTTIGNAQAGTNEIRSFGGEVAILLPDAMVMADAWGGGGTVGINLLTACVQVANSGVVYPADPVPGDDSGACAPAVPPALYADPSMLGVVWQ